MKKIIAVGLAVVLIAVQLVSLTSCKNEGEVVKTKYSTQYFKYFDTVSVITGYTETKEEFDAVAVEIEKL